MTVPRPERRTQVRRPLVLRTRLALAVLLLCGTRLAGAPPDAHPAPRPSVLLITLDTTRADALGAYGASPSPSPNLDALARSGARFTRAFTPVPLTLPAHASLLTGRLPASHGLRVNGDGALDPASTTLASILARAGYDTAAVVSAAVLDRAYGLHRGFRVYDDAVRQGPDGNLFRPERRADATTAAAVKLLEGLRPPWLLWVHYFDPHAPYDPPREPRRRFPHSPYAAEIAFMDEQLGTLVARARRTGPVLVMAAADHGEGLGEHGEREHGIFLYQSTVHVPWIVAGPGIPPGARLDVPASLIDALPSLLELLHLPVPGDLDGRSHAALLRGASTEQPPQPVHLESLYGWRSFGWSPLRAVVAWPWKLIAAPRPELYRLDRDPHERADLREVEAERVGRLAAQVPPLETSPAVPLSEQTAQARRRLASLGYVEPSRRAPPVDHGPDPKDMVGVLESLDAARAALRAGRPDEASRLARTVTRRNPANGPAWMVLAQAALAQEAWNEAEAAARRALDLRPDDPQAWLVLGNALARRPERAGEALKAYAQARELHPRYLAAYLNAASLEVRRGRTDEARRLLEAARDRGLDAPDLWIELGLLHAAAGRWPDAERALRRGLDRDPGVAEAWTALGRVRYETGDFRGAAAAYARALELRPDPDTARTLGSIRLIHLEDPAGALRAFREAVRLLPPGDARALELRALIAELESGGD